MYDHSAHTHPRATMVPAFIFFPKLVFRAIRIAEKFSIVFPDAKILAAARSRPPPPLRSDHPREGDRKEGLSGIACRISRAQIA